MGKTLWYIGLILVVLFFGVVVLMQYEKNRRKLEDLRGRYEAKLAALREAGEPVSLAELASPAIPDEENAAPVYEEVFGLLKAQASEVHDRISELLKADPLADEELEEARKLVEEAQPILERLRKAARLERCRFDLDYSRKASDELLFPHLAKFQGGGRLLVLSAKVNLALGRPDEAARDAAVGLKLRRCVEIQPTIIALLVDNAIGNITLKQFQKTLDEAEPSGDALKEVLSALGDVEDRSALTQAALGERCFVITGCASYLEHPEELDELSELIGEPEVRRLDRAEIYANALRTLEFWDVCLPLTPRPWHDSHADHEALNTDFGKGEQHYSLCAALVSSFERVPLTYDAKLAQQANAQQAIALRLYRMKHGEYPDTLEALAPEFLDKLPVDPFSGKTYVYRKEGAGFIVYSLGPNMIDDGGIEDSWDIDVGDLVWKCSR